MNIFLKQAKIGLLLFISVCVLMVAYTYFITGISQIAWPDKADGSLIYIDGKLVGSELIGQSFTSPGYFHGRPSAVDYDSTESASSNLGPTSAKLMQLVSERIAQVREENGLAPDTPIPADMVLASGSGLDPHISVENAMLQIGRVAKERGLAEAEVKALVEKHIEGLQVGFLGREKINVLKLNIALDELTGKK